MGRILKHRFVWIILVFLLAAMQAHATTIGMSPSIVHFNDMMRGGYAEESVTLSTDSQADVAASMTAEGDIADWVTFEPSDGHIALSKGKPYTFTMIIQPSNDTPSGNYTGKIKITTEDIVEVERGAGSSVIAQLELLVYVEVTGEESVSCRAGAISMSDVEVEDPLDIRATVYNDGNVVLKPNVIVDIWDQYQTKVLWTKSLLGTPILPTRSGNIQLDTQHNLGVGQYFAEVSFPECGISKMLTFDVLDKGAIADRGELLGIKTQDIVGVGETTYIKPLFTNTGSRNVLAQFQGEIRDKKTDKIVEVLESDKLEVTPGQTMEFNFFFTPKKRGEYVVTGKVLYNNKLTFEKSANIQANSNSFDLSGLLLFIVYLIIGFLILILISKIRKAQKKRRKRIF